KGNASKPTWGPDGKSLWFTTYEKNHEDIWVATDLTIPPPPPGTKAPTFKPVSAKPDPAKQAPTKKKAASTSKR
ncbi:MAG TPA: hypothetical protein VFM17_09685, partial [Candidatus Eisenbacteria bacterium]|nr:hypothetical protein [Candidatus Eisenbacteria bacterium]